MRLGVWGLFVLVLVSSVCTSKGLSIAPSPELLINPPQNKERSSSPAYPTKAGNDFAPNSATLPQATPPGAFLAPPLQPIPSSPPLAEPVEPAPASPHEEISPSTFQAAPPNIHPVPFLQASPPSQNVSPGTISPSTEPVEPAPASPHEEISPSTFQAAPPNIHPVPFLQASPPSQNVSPGTISPSTDGQPKGHSVPADEPSPSNLIPPPKADVNAKAPMNSPPMAMPIPHASAPARSVQPREPPVASPILTPPTVLAPPIQLVPPTAFAPQSIANAVPPTLARSPINHDKRQRAPVGAPPGHMNKYSSPVNSSHSKGSSPPSNLPHGDLNQTVRGPTTSHAPSPEAPLHLKPPTVKTPYPPALAPLPDHQRRDRKEVPKATSTSLSPSSSPSHSPGPLESHPPKAFPRSQRHRAPPRFGQDHLPSPVQSPAPSLSAVAPVPSPKPPVISPDSIPIEPKVASPSPPIIWSLPPPPPNLDCNSLVCSEPLTNPPPEAPCICVWPIKVGLRLKVEIYTFFPLVSEFAQEIASGIYMKQSQVRIMGANIASEQPEDSIVLLHLVPPGEKFDNSTAFLVYDRFWHKQIVISTATFGDYDVLYVLYPGLPASPPSASSSINFGDGSFGSRNNARTIKPLGVDIGKPKEKLSGSMIALIIVSSVVALSISIGAAWLLMLKERLHNHLAATSPNVMLPLFTKSSGTGHILLGKRPCSESGSFSSSVATCAGSAKTFSLAEIDRATNRFDESRIIGEGGFGRVYKGTLEDGTHVAVKVLKRYDLQGEREFLAEVEMLSRLHHRNLVKLIGICTEEEARCLVYELIGNGSVESHLHGVDKENAPLDWNARMKIALGAARGLAYLHEDSSPRVIHRDFKCSNILLEHDYTPKVSDFGLARAALDEGNQHISTQIMGTFGYVAPEYAMTGHLLVKSDVYSYGVVLLELLTGRKPVDMSRPPGQENLVAWARPLLTSTDGLETIVDPALGSKVAFDSIAKVAAIASMCVQPEVSHRPFMGEVVQALKLVCNECSESAPAPSDGCSQDESSSAQTTARRTCMLSAAEAELVLLASDMLATSPAYEDVAGDDDDSSSSSLWLFRSGPPRVAKSRQFWQRLRSMSAGSMNGRSISTTGTSLDGRSSEYL